MRKGLIKSLKEQIVYWLHWLLSLTAVSRRFYLCLLALYSLSCRDREIQLYELSTLEPYCQINALDTVPLTLDYGWATKLHVNIASKCNNNSQHVMVCVFPRSYTGPDKCCILYGDTEVGLFLKTRANYQIRIILYTYSWHLVNTWKDTFLCLCFRDVWLLF